nr:zinc finger, CCHC-type, retrotransposon Gag domain protein [Tanacetum cinerariifolium]
MFLNYALMIRQDYDITSSLRRGALQFLVSEPGYETVGSKDLTCEDWMVNTRTDADLSAAVQNALQTLLPQIREEIREEFRTGSGSSNAGGNPPPVTIYTWLERFNKQKPYSFEKATAPVDAENWISHMEKIIISCACHIRMWLRLPMLLVTMRSFMRGMMMTQSDQTSGRGVVIGISRPLSRVVIGATVIITTVMDLTGVVVVTTTAAATTTTTRAVTTG